MRLFVFKEFQDSDLNKSLCSAVCLPFVARCRSQDHNLPIGQLTLNVLPLCFLFAQHKRAVFVEEVCINLSGFILLIYFRDKNDNLTKMAKLSCNKCFTWLTSLFVAFFFNFYLL